MKKLPTLLPKDPNDLGLVIDGPLTVPVEQITHFQLKIDGTSVLIKDSKPYARYDAKLIIRKRGKVVKTLTPEEVTGKLPVGAIPCQDPDTKSGHWPHWVPVDETMKEYQYIWEAFTNLKQVVDGTYEAIGPAINGNKHNSTKHILIPHFGKHLKYQVDSSWKRNPYIYFRELFAKPSFTWEGIVAYSENTPIAKIRRSDFRYPEIKYTEVN